MNAQTMINSLLGSGLTQVELAQVLDCSQPYVSELSTGKKGARISFQFGIRLHALYISRCGSSKVEQINQAVGCHEDHDNEMVSSN